MRRVVARLVADTALVAILLFGAAGTVAWQQAWVLLGAMFLVRIVGALAVYRINPELLRERARLPLHAQQPWTDRALLLGVLATGFLGLPVVAGLDVFRWHALPSPAPVVADLGLALFVLGWSIKSLALWANAFAVTVVRMQRERAHAVADSGPYSMVRHPFYAADPLILVGLSLWLGSYSAAVVAVIPVSLMVMRLRLEERFLRRELPGYQAYTERVRYRLIPGLW
jgi:protein-S-isoprenylcysteine O-methyltransferase Ste14